MLPVHRVARFVIRQVALLGVLVAVAGVAACGSQGNRLAAVVVASDPGAVIPGETPTYVVRVINEGPGVVTGVTVHVDLPAQFQYLSTTDIGGIGQARTQPVDAQQHSRNPEWGLWSLPAPSTNADGTVVKAEVDITFTVNAVGNPGAYQMTASATSDSTESAANASPLAVAVAAAPHLAMVIGASPGTIRANDYVTYTATITNDGTGLASSTSVLVTLPGAFQYVSTVSIGGSSAREATLSPVRNSSVVDYGNFAIPARSDAGPGILTIVFRVQCLKGTPPGSYPVSGQVTTGAGDVITVRNTVPVNVVA